MEFSNLYDRPDLYDLMAPRDPILERFYVDLAVERGGRVLDLACGSGRLTIPLAQAGLQVIGGDLSREMLQRARKSAQAQGIELELVHLDMREFDLGGRTFDTIIVAMNSILHLHDTEDLQRFLRSAARHLSQDGRLVFDAFMPNVGLLNSDPEKRQLVGSALHDTLGKVFVEETIRYDPLIQVSHSDWYWSTSAQKDFLKTSWEMRQIFPLEMPLLITSAGVRLVERFGDFDRSPLVADSRRQVCVCARP